MDHEGALLGQLQEVAFPIGPQDFYGERLQGNALGREGGGGAGNLQPIGALGENEGGEWLRRLLERGSGVASLAAGEGRQ
jgi:hypothetical protein